jgi:NAD(P)H-nitrite reductase large subunit
VLGTHEPGALLMADRPVGVVELADDAEICACVGVTAGRIRGCSSLDDVRTTTRATTGCGGCADAVRSLLGATTLEGVTP